jgi:Peptidase family S41
MAIAEEQTARELVRQLCAWIDRLFPDRDRGERLTRALSDRFGDDPRDVSRKLCVEIEAVAHDFSRHFALEYVDGGGLVPDVHPPGWPPPDPEEVRARAGSVGEVCREASGIGILALDGLDDVRLAAPYVEAAFTLLRGASGIVLDLRRNGGGDPGTVMLVLDWLFRAPLHIADVIYRDRTRQWWTTGRLADRSLPEAVPVALLIGHRTFSSGEALAYHIQSRGRASVVGGRTRGAADHVTPVRVTSHVRAVLPEARVRDTVTGANWEATGVVPDASCDEADALDAALEVLRAA